tara:strand:- start:1474 stop:3009 length:1536 start_codon:yes stop_codon:yes gene_type:complete
MTLLTTTLLKVEKSKGNGEYRVSINVHCNDNKSFVYTLNASQVLADYMQEHGVVFYDGNSSNLEQVSPFNSNKSHIFHALCEISPNVVIVCRDNLDRFLTLGVTSIIDSENKKSVDTAGTVLCEGIAYVYDSLENNKLIVDIFSAMEKVKNKDAQLRINQYVLRNCEHINNSHVRGIVGLTINGNFDTTVKARSLTHAIIHGGGVLSEAKSSHYVYTLIRFMGDIESELGHAVFVENNWPDHLSVSLNSLILSCSPEYVSSLMNKVIQGFEKNCTEEEVKRFVRSMAELSLFSALRRAIDNINIEGIHKTNEDSLNSLINSLVKYGAFAPKQRDSSLWSRSVTSKHNGECLASLFLYREDLQLPTLSLVEYSDLELNAFVNFVIKRNKAELILNQLENHTSCCLDDVMKAVISPPKSVDIEPILSFWHKELKPCDPSILKKRLGKAKQIEKQAIKKILLAMKKEDLISTVGFIQYDYELELLLEHPDIQLTDTLKIPKFDKISAKILKKLA